MKKYKLLLSCNNQNLLGDFFVNARDSFSCLSTSEYYDDIKAHYEIFQPEAFICIEYKENAQFLSVLKRLKEDRSFFHIPIIMITSEESRKFYESAMYTVIDTILLRPISISAITERVAKRIDQIEEKLKQKEEEQRKIEEKQRKIEEEQRQKEVQRKKEEEQKQSEEIKPAENVPKWEKKRKHILVIDDDRAILKLLKAALDQTYDVTTMLNGKMAMKFLETKRPDLIFLDYQMPDEDGPEVYKKIRTLEAGMTVPIIFFTGVTDRNKIKEVMALKPQGYVLKPIDLEVLNSTLDRVFHRKKF